MASITFSWLNASTHIYSYINYYTTTPENLPYTHLTATDTDTDYKNTDNEDADSGHNRINADNSHNW